MDYSSLFSTKLILTNVQKRVLEKLLDKYENSMGLSTDTRTIPTFRIAPEEIWPGYGDSFTDPGMVAGFEREILLLEQAGLVNVRSEQGRIRSILFIKGEENRYYELIGRTEKNILREKEIEFYRQHSVSPYKELAGFCTDQLEQLALGKSAKYPIAEAEKICQFISRICANREELLESELSIEILRDAKAFSLNYRKYVCQILEFYGNKEEQLTLITDPEQRQTMILEEYGIEKAPVYVYFRGDTRIYMADGSVIPTSYKYPMALSVATVRDIQKIETQKKGVLTIENSDTYHSVKQPEFVQVCIGGYPNLCVQRFLMLLGKNYPPLNWCHFGDMDPEGYVILERLKQTTGLPFIPYCMGMVELERYREFGKPLGQQDLIRAQAMIRKDLYRQELSYMIEKKFKLDQSVIRF